MKVDRKIALAGHARIAAPGKVTGRNGAKLIEQFTAMQTTELSLLEDRPYVFDGFIDYYGYRPRSGGWFAAGWLAHPWPVGYRPEKAVAVFANKTMIECSVSLFYHRADLSGRGIGFVFFFESGDEEIGPLLSTLVESAGVPHPIYPSLGQPPISERELVANLKDLVAGGGPDSQQRKMRALLFGTTGDAPVTGYIDFHGRHTAAGGWLFSGWMTRCWNEDRPPERIIVSFDGGNVEGEAVAVLYPRHDLRDGAEGVAFLVRGESWPSGKLCSVSFEAGDVRATLYAAPAAARLREPELIAQFRPLLEQAAFGPHRDTLAELLVRQSYCGENSLTELSPQVLLEIDEAIRCEPEGLVLIGWLLAFPNEIAAIRVRSGSRVTELELETCIRIDRPDVIDAFAQHGYSDPRCGFVAYLADAIEPGSRVYLEVETTRHEVRYRNLPSQRLEGLAAAKRLLSVADVRFGEVQPSFDRVLGPAMEALTRSRLARPAKAEVIEYGQVATRPRFSVIVPLHGRLDFVEYQLALFSAHPDCAEIEFIYVLDDPPKRKAAQHLFASVFERFRIPFRAVLLDRNVGFAPANNIGLAQAHGTFVSFLNSDVFPETADFLGRLADVLDADPSIGVAGPVLLYEDGSVQHRGMYFTRLAEFGNWHFGQHHGKGLRPTAAVGLETHISITGACMVMRRDLALELGGFDEIFAVGDFEDSDLCLRLQERGYRCVIDHAVRLFHLERKSQASSALGWRMNLTLYNAWQHERRWARSIMARQAS